MSDENSNISKEEEKNDSQKILNKKRNPTFSLEDIINIYCCTHKIKDNEIMEKIKTIHYEKPSESIETNYDRDNGDTFPLSKHLKPVHLKNGIKLDEEKNEEKKEESEEQNKDEILNCFVCGWEFLKGMSFQEKNTHINLCIEGKGEQNKKELISTYAEIENLQKNNQEGDNNNVNEKQNNEVKEVNENRKNEKQKEEDGDNNDGDESENKIKKNKRYFIDDNDDLML